MSFLHTILAILSDAVSSRAPPLFDHSTTTMGKKQNKDSGNAPNPNAIQNKEALQRLNFLYQSSAYLAQIAAPSTSQHQDPTSSSEPTADGPGKRKRKRSEIEPTPKERPISRRGRESLLDLSRQHSRSMKVIAKKSVLRM